MEKKENFDNLDDLLLEPKKDDKLKKILLGSAVLLIVLILIILVTKSFVEGESKNKAPVMLPPEPAAKQAEQEKKEPLFQEVPIVEEQTTPTKTVPVHEISPSQPAATPQQPPKAQKAVPKPTLPAAEKEVVKSKNLPTKSKISKPKKTSKPVTAKGRYYIQVGAFFRKEPSRKFLESLRRAGFNYTTMEGTKNGIRFKKLLVGPYPSRSAAKKDLAIIKRRINQNAYIFKK